MNGKMIQKKDEKEKRKRNNTQKARKEREESLTESNTSLDAWTVK